MCNRINISRSFFVAILSLLIFQGCNNYKRIVWQDSEPMSSDYAREGDEISISYPIASGSKIADNINSLILTYISSSLIGVPEATTIQAGLDSILAERNRDTIFPPYYPYSFTLDGEVLYYENVISVLLTSYRFTGGAHGNSEIRVLNIDQKTGELLTLSDIFSDIDQLKAVNHDCFTEKYAHDTAFMGGLFIEPDDLPLPDNMSLESTGLHVYYNQYEIAPYYYGIIEYDIPIKSIEHLLK